MCFVHSLNYSDPNSQTDMGKLTSWCITVRFTLLLRGKDSSPKIKPAHKYLKVTVPLPATRGSSTKPWLPEIYGAFMWYREDDPFNLQIWSAFVVIATAFLKINSSSELHPQEGHIYTLTYKKTINQSLSYSHLWAI